MKFNIAKLRVDFSKISKINLNYIFWSNLFEILYKVCYNLLKCNFRQNDLFLIILFQLIIRILHF